MNDFSPTAESFEYARALQNMILVYVALKMEKEAALATMNHISRFGRLPWPERRALETLNINADAFYIMYHGRNYV